MKKTLLLGPILAVACGAPSGVTLIPNSDAGSVAPEQGYGADAGAVGAPNIQLPSLDAASGLMPPSSPDSGAAPPSIDAGFVPGPPAPPGAKPDAALPQPVPSHDAGFSPPAESDDAGSAPVAARPESVSLIPMEMNLDPATGDWIMSRTVGEGAPAYAYTGTQFNVFDTQGSASSVGAATVPLYRCIDSHGTHYQATNPSDPCDDVAGKVVEGILGYVYPASNNPGGQTQPIYRCIGSSGHPIVMTMRLSDCTGSGWIVQAQFGYAYPATVMTTP